MLFRSSAPGTYLARLTFSADTLDGRHVSATSALDEETEERLYARLTRDLPGLTLVSIAHRSSLRRFHEHEMQL